MYAQPRKRRHLAFSPEAEGAWLPSQYGRSAERPQRHNSNRRSRVAWSVRPLRQSAGQSGSEAEAPQVQSRKVSPGETRRTSGRRSGDELESASPAMPDQSTQTRALRNMRSQPPSSCQSSGRQEFCTARNTRSGCGIMMVTRPSRLLSPVMPRGDPLGLAG